MKQAPYDIESAFMRDRGKPVYIIVAEPPSFIGKTRGYRLLTNIADMDILLKALSQLLLIPWKIA